MKKIVSMLAAGFLFAFVVGISQDFTTASQGISKNLGGSESSEGIGISPRRCPPYC